MTVKLWLKLFPAIQKEVVLELTPASSYFKEMARSFAEECYVDHGMRFDRFHVVIQAGDEEEREFTVRASAIMQYEVEG